MKNNVLVELQLANSDWCNVSSYRYDRAPITITRGRSANDTKASPGTANFTLNNTSGLFSPRNPSSPLFGAIKRNTPARISRGTGAYGMVTSGIDNSAGRAYTNDSAAVSITGDIDIRVDLEVLAAPISEINSSWTAGNFDIASKFDDADPARSWTLINILGNLRFNWFALGTVASARSANSVSLGGAAKGRRALRVTVDVDNGAGGTTVTFYTATSLAAGNAGGWTVLGTPVISAGTTAILDGTASVRVGGNPTGSIYTYGESAAATYYGFELRSGIGGSVVASCDFTSLPLDPAPISSSDFVDAQGNTWGFAGLVDAARVWWGNVDVRFVGELSSLPPRWGPSHKDKYIELVASDVLRRYQQGTSPVATGLRDYVLSSQQALLSYFPLSSQEGTQYERNIANTNRLVYNFYNEALPGKPVFKYGVDMGAPWIGSGMEYERDNGGWMRGDTVSWDSNVAFDFVWQSPSLGALSVTLRDYNGYLWTLALNDISDSGLGQVSFTDPATGPLGFATFAVPEINDTDMHIGRLQITNNGANIDYAVYVDGTVRKTGTMAGYNTLGSAYFFIQYSHANTGQVAVNLAHLVTWANAVAAAIPTAAAVAAAALGYAGEKAGRRIERVAAAGALPIVFKGDLDKTTAMGVQYAEARLAQIRDAESTDFGMLATARKANSLWYRTRQSLYNQTAALVLDYSAKVVAPPFEPVDDDEATRNNITASRRDGGSYQIVKTSGPLAAIDPPVGIGQYEDEITVNVQTDAQLAGVAAWFLNWGTLDAARYPSVTVNLEALPQMIGQGPADTLIAQVLAVDLGDLVQVNNITAADIPDNIELIALGYTEVITNTSWLWTANCSPADLYRVAVFGAGKYDAQGSVLTAAVTAGATSFQVSQTGTSLWTVQAGAFPFDIYVNGERMTVTNVTSATSPQTFTVTRGVNGVSKAHPISTPVRLWSTPRFAL